MPYCASHRSERRDLLTRCRQKQKLTLCSTNWAKTRDWSCLLPFSLLSMVFFNHGHFLDFCTVFFDCCEIWEIKKAHCSPPLVGEVNSMVFTSHSVPFPATRDLWSLVAGNGTSRETKTISFSSHQ